MQVYMTFTECGAFIVLMADWLFNMVFMNALLTVVIFGVRGATECVTRRKIMTWLCLILGKFPGTPQARTDWRKPRKCSFSLVTHQRVHKRVHLQYQLNILPHFLTCWGKEM